MEDARERVGELLLTPKGQSFTREEVSEMFKQATRSPNPIEAEHPILQWLSKNMGQNLGVVDWGKFEEVLKRKLEDQ